MRISQNEIQQRKFKSYRRRFRLVQMARLPSTKFPIASEPGRTIGLTAGETEARQQEHVGVVIDVPQTLLAKIYGNPAALLESVRWRTDIATG